MINSARLQVLLEIARLGTIVAAAEQLRLSPSAVSHQLSTLEREVGVALVERGHEVSASRPLVTASPSTASRWPTSCPRPGTS
jgi:DNA-binding transcriptional LysR family regulator